MKMFLLNLITYWKIFFLILMFSPLIINAQEVIDFCGTEEILSEKSDIPGCAVTSISFIK